jgi:hypothetical protein
MKSDVSRMMSARTVHGLTRSGRQTLAVLEFFVSAPPSIVDEDVVTDGPALRGFVKARVYERGDLIASAHRVPDDAVAKPPPANRS